MSNDSLFRRANELVPDRVKGNEDIEFEFSEQGAEHIGMPEEDYSLISSTEWVREWTQRRRI